MVKELYVAFQDFCFCNKLVKQFPEIADTV